MSNNLNLPAQLAGLMHVISQPGTKTTLESTTSKQTITIKNQNADFSFQAKIQIYPDGTKTESLTTSPNVPAKDKKVTMEEMKKDGNTQKQIADATGVSQSTVSRTLNS